MKIKLNNKIIKFESFERPKRNWFFRHKNFFIPLFGLLLVYYFREHFSGLLLCFLPTLFESYTTEWNDVLDFTDNGSSDDYMVGQTFTPASDHSVTSIKFRGFRAGTAGTTVKAQIFATSGGIPTGSELASGTIAGSAVGASPGDLYEVTMGTPCDLTSGTLYVLVMSGIGWASGDYVRWRCDTTTPSYTGGNAIFKDGASAWSVRSGTDMIFEIWGVASAVTYTKNLTLKYHLFNTVTDSLTLKWNLYKQISKSLIIKYNLGGVVTKVLTLKWHLLNTLEKNLTLKWNLFNSVSKSITLKWNLFNQVTKNLILKWTLYKEITKSLILKWTLYNQVLKSLTLKWTLYQETIKILTLKYNLLNTLTKALNLRWYLFNTVTKSFTLKWTLYQQITKTLTIKWHLFQVLVKTLIIKYHLISIKGLFISRTKPVAGTWTKRTKPSQGPWTNRTKPY